MTKTLVFLFVLLAAAACARKIAPTTLASSPPPLILGEFEDDYRGRHTVSSTQWIQHPRSRYHIVRWVPDSQFLVARNDSANKSAPGKWTRIDWLPLSGMPPYEWAFCFSAYEAPTRAAAESTTIARRETPRTGCNGFPFTRMRRVQP